ncbi:unnamed protein product [Fusarium venenatum]|uniref:Uncharacterized protein n=1 Tax=Fusarium venenatum TaxID=56646 RepID=A0A2L2TIM7_9HYPO|nr:uncharacterized protein FVRRES_09916 [Fusarium venenatum]CEI69839.1 unnamed protein product [Fusarium venenatum]
MTVARRLYLQVRQTDKELSSGNWYPGYDANSNNCSLKSTLIRRCQGTNRTRGRGLIQEQQLARSILGNPA